MSDDVVDGQFGSAALTVMQSEVSIEFQGRAQHTSERLQYVANHERRWPQSHGSTEVTQLPELEDHSDKFPREQER